MAAQTKCPECSTVLKLNSPVADGKKIRCPRCKTCFQPGHTAPPSPPRPARAEKDPDEFLEDSKKPARPRRKAADSDPDIRPRRKRDASSDKIRLFVLLGVLGVVALAGGTMLLVNLLSNDNKPVAQGQNLNNRPLDLGPRFDPDDFRFDPQDDPPKKPGDRPDGKPPDDKPGGKPPVGKPTDEKPPDWKPPADKDPPKGPKVEDEPGPAGPPPPLPSAKDRPFLALDSGGHTAMCRKILFSPDGKQVISVSMDKTVRVWDVQSGETVRRFHVPVGPAEEGSLFSAAISRDGRKLAVGGIRIGGVQQGSLVYLIDMSSGKAERTFSGHDGAITSLAFSPDGKWLASASNDGTAIVYNVLNGQRSRHLVGHKDGLNGMAYSPDGKWLATACRDGTARLWNLSTGKVAAELLGHTSKVNCVAFTHDSRTIITGSADATVRLWGLDGKMRQNSSLHGPRNDPVQIVSLTISRDNREALFTGIGATGYAGMLDLATGKVRVEFKEHNNTATTGALSPDGRLAVTHGGDRNESFIWQTATGAVVHRLVGKGQSVWVAGWSPDGKAICWGNTNRGEAAVPERFFRLDTFDFTTDVKAYLGAARAANGWSLERQDFFRIAIKQNGRLRHTFQAPSDGERIYSFTLTTGNRAIMGGSFGLYLVDLNTNQIVRRYRGHSGIVAAVSPSPDGRYFISGGGDQVLNIFHHDRDEPLLSFFFAGREWIAWTPEGYYTASVNGERLMGWLINTAPDRLADYFPAIRFRASLFQPDAVPRTLRAGSVQRALELVAKEKNRPAQSADLTNVLPPEVAITSPGEGDLNQAKVEVKATARSTGNHPVTTMRLLVDGRPWQGVKGTRTFPQPKPGEVQASWEVELPPGRHQLVVLADSAVSRGSSTPVDVTRSGEDGDLPNLYVLAMGISAYSGRLKLHYAASDAELIAETFRARSAGVFRTVQVKTITDQEATKKGMLTGLNWLQSVMTARDVAIVSFSGHGYRDPLGNFYLVPVDVNMRDMKSFLPGEVFKDALANLPGKVVCLLDACHSGSVADEVKPTRADDLVRDLVNDEYGVVVMCSSLGSEVSLESPATKAGFFTLSIVEGLTGKADYNGDQVVYVHELDFYAAKRVQEMSGGLQNPTTGRPPNIRSFPLSKP